MARDYSSMITTKPHGTAVMEPGDEAIVLHGSDTIQSCLTPRVTEVKAIMNIERPQLAIVPGTDNAPTCEGRLRCGTCGQYKSPEKFGKRARAITRMGRDFVCRKCRQMEYDENKRQRLERLMNNK